MEDMAGIMEATMAAILEDIITIIMDTITGGIHVMDMDMAASVHRF